MGAQLAYVTHPHVSKVACAGQVRQAGGVGSQQVVQRAGARL